MKSYQVDFKHEDMKRALDVISEKIDDVQRRRDHYKKMASNEKVQIPDRFGNKIFEAREMVWLYECEHTMLQGLYSDIYALFKLEAVGRPKNAASSRPQPSAAQVGSGGATPEKE